MITSNTIPHQRILDRDYWAKFVVASMDKEENLAWEELLAMQPTLSSNNFDNEIYHPTPIVNVHDDEVYRHPAEVSLISTHNPLLVEFSCLAQFWTGIQDWTASATLCL